MIQTSSIPGTPPIDFSPDDRLVYAINSDTIGIYALQPSTGNITASSILSDSGNISVATATPVFRTTKDTKDHEGPA